MVDPDLVVVGTGGDGDAELVAGAASGGLPSVMVVFEFVPELSWPRLHGDSFPEIVVGQCLMGRSHHVPGAR